MIPHPPARSRAIYEVLVAGQLDPLWAGWFEGMTLTNLPTEEQVLIRGPVIDQSDLHGLLNKIRDLNLELILVRKVED